jgi:hypothetical protein
LIIAGTVAGQNLVRQAKIRATLQEANQYVAAVNAFYLQYNAYPGDMSNAQSYWSAATNGNGNRLIGDFTMEHYESLGAFQQLALGGLIPGTYTGSGTPSLGVNVPKAVIGNNASYHFYGSTLWERYPRGNSIALSGVSNVGYDSPKILVGSVYSMDIKIDDGLPYTGKIVAYSEGGGHPDAVCVDISLANGANKLTSVYLIQNANDLCIMHFALNSYIFK